MSAPALFMTATNGIRSSYAVRTASSRVSAWSVVSGAAGSSRSNSTHDTRRSPSSRTARVIGPGQSGEQLEIVDRHRERTVDDPLPPTGDRNI